MRPLATSASQTRALWLLAVLAAVAFVKLAADLLIPIVLSLLVALALEPIVGWQGGGCGHHADAPHARPRRAGADRDRRCPTARPAAT